MTTVELFAGIGGFRLAAEENHLSTIWANDINHDAVTVYQSVFGKKEIIEGDINDYLSEIPNHDILTGGFPCQPFSKAGKKQGVADYRGTLFESIVKILLQKKPSFFILENVNTLLTMDNGFNFKTILSALSALEYKIEWRVFNAMSFGLPQHRERVIIVGSLSASKDESYLLNQDEVDNMDDDTLEVIAFENDWDDLSENKKKFMNWGMAYKGTYVTNNVRSQQFCKGKRLFDIIQKDADRSFDFTEDTLSRLKNSQYVNKFYNGVQILYNQSGGARMGYSVFGTDGIAPTLTASSSRHYERYKIGEIFRRLTNVEYARIQGFPDHHCDAVSTHKQYALFGNAVPPQIISYVMKRIIHQCKIQITPHSVSLFNWSVKNA